MTETGHPPGRPHTHWFAFVESEDPFHDPNPDADQDDWLGQILAIREKAGLEKPRRVAWLSCIRASYFEGLEWRDEPCTIGDEDQGELRRERILSLDAHQLLLVPLLLSRGSEERAIHSELERHDWHTIRLESDGRFPVWTIPETIGDAGFANGLDYLGACSDVERAALRKVFNLDFLQDEGTGREEHGPPAPVIVTPPTVTYRTKSASKKALAKQEKIIDYPPPKLYR